MHELMKSGEFAKLCRTTKETLRHYDAIGLLSPACHAENGYGLYSSAQLIDFALISALRSAGVPLKKMAPLLRETDNRTLLTSLEASSACLQLHIEQLQRKLMVLQGTARRMRRLDSWTAVAPDEEGNRWSIERFPEEYFIEGPTSFLLSKDPALDEVLLEHVAFCREHDFGMEMQSSYRIARMSMEGDDEAVRVFVASRIAAPVDSDRMRCKPTGTYLCLLSSIYADESSVEDEGNPLARAARRLLAKSRAEGIPTTGDIFISELGVGREKTDRCICVEFSIKLKEGSRQREHDFASKRDSQPSELSHANFAPVAS